MANHVESNRLHAFQETEADKIENDADFTKELAAAIDKVSEPLKENSPFFETDLRIFRTDASKIVALNGISTEELQEIEALSTSIRIIGPDSFTIEIVNAIKKLLSRKLGRELFRKALTYQNPIIIEAAQKNCYKRTTHTIHLNSGSDNVCLVYFNGAQKSALASEHRHLSLAHELIHLIHDKKDLGKFAERIDDSLTLYDFHMDTAEEQVTISGWGSLPVVQFTDEEPPIDRPLMSHMYDALNEQNLEAVFSHKIRANHRAIGIHNRQVIHYVSADLYGDVQQLLHTSQEARDSINTRRNGSKRIALTAAAHLNNVKMIELLLKHGADLRAIDGNGQNAFQAALDNDAFDAAFYLLQQDIKWHTTNVQWLYDTALRLSSVATATTQLSKMETKTKRLASLRTFIQKALTLGLDLNGRNMLGMNIFMLAIRNMINSDQPPEIIADFLQLFIHSNADTSDIDGTGDSLLTFLAKEKVPIALQNDVDKILKEVS